MSTLTGKNPQSDSNQPCFIINLVGKQSTLANRVDVLINGTLLKVLMNLHLNVPIICTLTIENPRSSYQESV